MMPTTNILCEMKALIDTLRSMEEKEEPVTSNVVPIVESCDQALLDFLDGLNESSEGITIIGPYKIHYEPKNWYLYEDEQNGFLEKAVGKEFPNYPVSNSEINGVSYAIFKETASTGMGGGSAGSSGGQMVGGPETYEQENAPYRSRGPRRIMAMTSESLDSSYPYKSNPAHTKFYFSTKSGVDYYAYFSDNSAGDGNVEFSFSSSSEDGKPKTGLTGTGDSRRVFGTIKNVIKDYVGIHSPSLIYFSADADEPSRVKLYKALMSTVEKELPDYEALEPTTLSNGVFYTIKHKDDISE